MLNFKRTGCMKDEADQVDLHTGRVWSLLAAPLVFCHTICLCLWCTCTGIVATLVCFPLDLVRTRLMSRSKAPNYGSGPFSTLVGILKHEGPAALYTGEASDVLVPTSLQGS